MNASQYLAGSRFLVIGRAGMDLVADPPGQEIVGAGRFVTMLGGSSANIAAGLARHGCQVALATRVSDDAIGRFVIHELDGYGIDRRHVGVVGGEHRTSLALVESRPVNTQSIIYRNQAADFAFDQTIVDAIDFAAHDCAILTGTALAAEPSRSACLSAMAKARQAGLRVFLDIDYRPYSWGSQAEAGAICLEAANLADVVIGNDEEFQVLAGREGNGLELAARLGNRPGAASIYKMGPLGSVAHIGERTIHTGIFKVSPLKPTGAGDAFMAGLSAGLAAGADWPEAIIAGSASAAIVVSRVGCAPAMPDRATLDAFLNSNSISEPPGA